MDLPDCNCNLSKDIDYYNLPLDCPKVWELLERGLTKGIFQLESQLCKQWTKQVKPTCVDDMSAIGALVRPGTLNCISGNTLVTIDKRLRKNNSGYAYKKDTIANLYQKHQNKFHKYKSKILSVNSDTFTVFNNTIKNVFDCGKQEVYKPIFRTRKNQSSVNFYNLECTLLHKLFVYNKGWTTLQDIESGDRIALKNNGQFTKTKENTKHIRNHSSFRDIAYIHYQYCCIFCDWNLGTLDVNHIDGNRKTNNHPDNLCFLCPNHHRMYSENRINKQQILFYREQFKLNHTEDIVWGEYVDKISMGEIDTYDIEVEGMYPNYIAGNVLVHNSTVDGKNMVQHYVDRKNGIEPVPKYHPIFDEILKDTYGVITFQEQAIKLAEQLAGFNLSEADTLRKAMGKKIAEEMAKVEKMFLEKAKTFGVITEEQAKFIFAQIKSSQRYSFNRCITLDTVVNTKEGYKTLDEVQIGDFVLAPNTENHINEFVEVKQKYNHGKKELYEITLESGKTIKCTLDHKFLADDLRVYMLEEIIEKNLKIICESD